MDEREGVLCIYHGNCVDGFGAAWVVRKRFGEGVVFHPGRYQEPPPLEAARGRTVYVVDFSYPREGLTALAREARHVVVIDHHQSAEPQIRGLDGVEVHFDLEHSGAMLTWRVLFPGEEPPALLRYIEDRDLWRNALPNGREVSAALFSYPYEFGIWDWLMEEPIGTFIRAGAAIERKHWKDLHELVARGRREMLIGGYRVPVVNLPYTMASDAAGYLAEEAPFAASYWESERGREFSLRSKPGGADVAAVAEQYGGGGHRHAAGFLAPWGASLSEG